VTSNLNLQGAPQCSSGLGDPSRRCAVKMVSDRQALHERRRLNGQRARRTDEIGRRG
jgi:hypothetical protein